MTSQTKRVSPPTAFALSALLFVPGVATADEGPEPTVTPHAFKEVLLDYVNLIDEMSGSSSELYGQINDLNAEEMQAVFDVFENKALFAGAVDDLVGHLEVRAKRHEFQEHAERVTYGVVGILGTPAVEAAYPAPDGAWFTLLGILGLANDERCDPDFLGTAMTTYQIANAAAIAAQALCDALIVILGEGTNAPACVAAGIANGVAFGANFVIEQCDVSQAAVDSAEIKATYENSLLIVEGLQCVTVDQGRRHHGCNGEDDDCDGIIDECDEDTAGPIVHINAAVQQSCYDDATEATEAVAAAVEAFDDCGEVTVGAPVLSGSECDVTIEVTATDDCGNPTTVSTQITIDGDGPDITFDPSINSAGVCYDSIDAAEQAVLNGATITDNCGGSAADFDIKVHSSVTECALRVQLTVTDDCGNESTAAITVRVDTHLPRVDVEELLLGFRGEVLGFQTPVCYDTVTQAESAVLTATAFGDNCTADEALITSVSSQGEPCRLEVNPMAVDECLNDNIDSIIVRVDNEAPVVTCGVTIDTLPTPNHKMANVGFTYDVTDNCSGDPLIEIFITSDETTASASGAGQASPAPDSFVLRDLDDVYQGTLIRAERSTAGDGRIYEITVRATDDCGNVGSCSATVGVPPNSNGTPVDSGQYYDATEVN
jgi:hypothetical protein